jgi:Ca-activated chloride channel family protein
MKNFIFILIGLIASFQLSAIDPVGKIAKANAAKERAEEALKKGDFKKVVEHYTYLLDSLGYESHQAELNRAHAYFQLKDTVNAFDSYRRVSDASTPQLKSKAMLQMGNLSEMQKEYESALSFFKEALKADPSNNKARYNYELLKKKMQEQEKQNQDQNQDQENKDQEKQDQENQDQQNKENKDSENQKQDKNQEKSQEDKESEEQQQKDDAEQQDGEQNEQDKGKEQEDQKQKEQKEGEEQKDGEEQEMKPSTKQKLQEMNISEEKAQMILEALRNKESQYFQQLRKKATKKQDSGKPDW